MQHEIKAIGLIVCQHPCRVPEACLHAIKMEVAKMLQDGIIEESTRPSACRAPPPTTFQRLMDIVVHHYLVAYCTLTMWLSWIIAWPPVSSLFHPWRALQSRADVKPKKCNLALTKHSSRCFSNLPGLPGQPQEKKKKKPNSNRRQRNRYTRYTSQ